MFAEGVLRGVGNKELGQWTEYTGRAFHVRRRLSEEEQKLVGEAKDIRNTPEAKERLEKALDWLRFYPDKVIHQSAAEAGFSLEIKRP